MFSIAALIVRAHLDFCKSRGQTLIFAVLEALLMSPLHHVLNWEVCALINVKRDVYKNGYRRRSCTSKTAQNSPYFFSDLYCMITTCSVECIWHCCDEQHMSTLWLHIWRKGDFFQFRMCHYSGGSRVGGHAPRWRPKTLFLLV